MISLCNSGEIQEASFSRRNADSSKSGIQMDRDTLNHLILSSREQGGDIELARKLFRDEIAISSSSLLDKECCTQLILAFDRNNLYGEIVQVGEFMVDRGIHLTMRKCYSILFKACTKLRSLQLGMKLQSHPVNAGKIIDNYTQIRITQMYERCGHMKGLNSLFNEKCYEKQHTFTWNTLISAFGRSGDTISNEVVQSDEERRIEAG